MVNETGNRNRIFREVQIPVLESITSVVE